MNGDRSEKQEVISYTLQQSNIKDLSKVIMIGDCDYDIIGANQLGIDCIGVLFGYGNKEELEKAGADYFAETVEGIGYLLM